MGGDVGSRLEFRILGPLEVRLNGAPVRVGGPKQRALLALLLCNANRVVSRDQLIDELLSDQPAGPAEPVLHVQVSRLRKALADGDPQPRLLARAPGYLLRVEDGELDLHAFDQRVAEGVTRWRTVIRAGPRRCCATRSRCGAAGRWPILSSNRLPGSRCSGSKRAAWPWWRTGSRRSWRSAGTAPCAPSWSSS